MDTKRVLETKKKKIVKRKRINLKLINSGRVNAKKNRDLLRKIRKDTQFREKKCMILKKRNLILKRRIFIQSKKIKILSQSVEQIKQQLAPITLQKIYLAYYDNISYINLSEICQKYTKIMIESQNISDCMRRQNKIYVNQLKIQIYNVYTSILQNESLLVQEQYMVAWKYFIKDHLFSILENQNVLFKVFKMWDNDQEQVVRQTMIRKQFKYSINQLKKQNKNFLSTSTKIKENQLDFIYLIGKQSFFSHINFIKTKSQQTINIIKNSWYVRYIMTKFLQGRNNYLSKKQKQNKSLIQINQEIIRNYIKDIQIYLLDYPDSSELGFTEKNKNKKFTIFINLFLLNKYFNMLTLDGTNELISSYIMFVLLHEISYCLARSLSIIDHDNLNDNDIDNGIILKIIRNFIDQRIEAGQNVDKKLEEQLNQKVKIGYLFQIYAFGHYVSQIRQNDFESVEKLLRIKQKPSQWKYFDILGNFQKCSSFLLNDFNSEDNLRNMEQEENQNFQQNPIKNTQRNTLQIKQMSSKQIKQTKKEIKILKDQISNIKQTAQYKQQNQVDEDIIGNKIRQLIKFNKRKQEKQYMQIKDLKEQIKTFQLFGTRESKEYPWNKKSMTIRENKYNQISLNIGRCGNYLMKRWKMF